MFKVYILKSDVRDRYYIGYTNNLVRRLLKHNAGSNHSTRPYRPWKVVYSETLPDKRSAWLREQQIKSYKGGEAFKKLLP
ncbi:endonuclease [Candidatus Kaiserbacteria bacterium RIFCSPHIGHO2_01_FULL_49_13]|uniref:Endonuclease n=1 Tax=Candidatus Kaiserbacteria bacterium RIFCSPHIGHO2_01_FULL_49_13 TaxID=1798477 RepID=A0A1F6CF31_9BACT|nr:MAG: endonuclease [Candidatus Kaiserbacteria bacterium RIFCSPHIGHO2_01_FULL_49_13]